MLPDLLIIIWMHYLARRMTRCTGLNTPGAIGVCVDLEIIDTVQTCYTVSRYRNENAGIKPAFSINNRNYSTIIILQVFVPPPMVSILSP